MPASSDFTPHVGGPFRFGATELQLTKVETHTPSGDGREAFTLIFAGPPHPLLPEGSYPATGPHGDATPLYIIPIHTVANDRQDYQVVFN